MDTKARERAQRELTQVELAQQHCTDAMKANSHESPMPESAIVASAASSSPPPLHRGPEGTEVANAQHEADLDYEREIDKAKARHRGCMLGVHKRCLRRGEAVGNEFYCNLHKK